MKITMTKFYSGWVGTVVGKVQNEEFEITYQGKHRLES